MALRNAFAHHATDAQFTVFVHREPEKDEAHPMLHILRSNGTFEKMRRIDALAEFNQLYGRVKKSLVELHDLVKGSV